MAIVSDHFFGSQAIPDFNLVGIDNVLLPALPTGAHINDIIVSLDITHTWDADLQISLIAPDGTSTDLSSGNGGTGDNYATVFSDGAATSITAGAPPFAGVFQPELPLSNLFTHADGGSGAWTLRIVDDSGGDTGTLTAWAISIDYTYSGTVTGTAGSDPYLQGSDGVDKMFGLAGNDVLVGLEGNDVLDGGPGGDTLGGQDGNDTASYATASAGVVARLDASAANTGDAAGDSYVSIENLTGSAFNDTLYGDAAANILTGGAGNDILNGRAGNDQLNGGTGNDRYFIDSTADVLIDASGIDTVNSTVTKTLASGFENLTLLGTANINGTGNTAANILTGNAGINNLKGLGGNDTLNGGSGNDILTGGAGRDTMTGGSGNDHFDFNAFTETGKTSSTRDVITDFRHGFDDIDLSTIDANGSAAGNTAFSFLAVKGAAFTGAHGQLHWFQQNPSGTANDKTVIEGDINGDGVADFQIQLSGLKTLTSGDFLL